MHRGVDVAQKRQSPGDLAGRGFCCLIGQLPTLPHTRACSTIGAVGLNCRVRDGNGWDPYARITQKSGVGGGWQEVGKTSCSQLTETFGRMVDAAAGFPTTHLPPPSRILMGATSF